MAVVEEPFINNTAGQGRQDSTTSQKIPRTKPIKNDATPPQQEDEYLRVTVTSLDRTKRDPIFKLKATTNMSKFKQKTYQLVERTYTEFERLYDSMTYANPECIVPALPSPASSFAASDEDERRVKRSVQQWLNRIASNPILRHDEELRSFVETSFTFIPTSKPRKRSSGFRLKFSTRTVQDDDHVLTNAKAVATVLEGYMLESTKAVQKLAKSRKSMAVCNTDLGMKAITFATSEQHPPLSSGFRKLGKMLQSIAELQHAQASVEVAILGDFFAYYAINARVVKETLSNRIRITTEYETAKKNTISKRRYIERLKASTSIKPERVDDALEDLEYAKSYEENLGARLIHVTKNLHNELTVYEENRTQDFLNVFKEFAKKQILYEKQQLKAWEDLRPDINAITKKSMRVHALGDEDLNPRAVAERLSTYTSSLR
ncbi:8737_t:CDS:2 [Paraglomus occultum]|uniref:8737_t:CDS:1 n=1 Tax=Paraglomus occultum TaxID=144539 RepID=A0A9N8Z3K3_9GLOM|nr:8737_t:CDS:2 [Paraglomus occultum]